MPTVNHEERTERLEARTTRLQKDLFKQAADLQGRSLSDFIVQSAYDAAMRVVEQHQIIALTAEEQRGFVKALLDPPKPGPPSTMPYDTLGRSTSRRQSRRRSSSP